MGLVRASEARHKKRGREGNIAYTREEVEEMLNSGLLEKTNKGDLASCAIPEPGLDTLA